MIANAKRWALARGLVRNNEVHGLEEYKIPTFEGFSFTNEALQRNKMHGSFEVEDSQAYRLHDMIMMHTPGLKPKSFWILKLPHFITRWALRWQGQGLLM